MNQQSELNQSPSSAPSTKYSLIENIIEIARKDEAVLATQGETERIVEELFFHITKFSDDDLAYGRISIINDEDVNSNEYNLSLFEIPYFNNLIRIINRLFRISRGTL